MESKTQDTRESYDFVVCGGGTAGCVVAAGLAEDPNITVLVIEAGPHNEHLENVHMVGGWADNFDKGTDWNIITPPGTGINNRQVKLSRGKFLGGCSGCNGTLCIRGSKQDYDDWQVPGWSGEEFFEYMRKAESFVSKPWFKASEVSHGYGGKLGVEPHDLAPISQLMLKSMESKGLKLDDDMFSHGENPHGCGHAPRTVTNGLRTTGADFVTNVNARKNIIILTNAHVEKVILERDADGELKATGVKFISGDGQAVEVVAKKEVIVSGGAYCSPNILNRSGIGAKEELEKVGVATLVDLPGVGKNLTDHLIVFIFYEVEPPGLTTDHLLYHSGALAQSYKLWLTEKKGVLSTFPFGAFAFARLDERLSDSELWNKAPRDAGRDPMGLTPRQPNVEFFTTECYGGPKQYSDFPTNGKSAFSIIAELFAPRSRGTVTLKDANPLSAPVVDCQYLTDPLDVEVLAEACRFGNEIVMQGSGTKDVVKGSWPPEARHHTFSSREDWVPFVKNNATTCYHASGTCRMGDLSDERTVVDQNLCVKGVKSLRVVDVSIMPILHGGHTQMPAFGIGEKAADLIRKTWKLSSEAK
ncbi:Glucose-methanol-choline oxidoreductase [Cordyceps fumosorosea ARSEF 2679]|uniref:Glucose-methanol-choline oxidoreductase n=1 Tax=Cordyceps fumosorosea (strain ARSEF 2679) TaxID=1081104 RepID=A0A167RRW2_CORFA|nr:Glucose-methanol-choline oxidoreductase [Cordyceps fumosorosea ARSEF 2679]OAA58871.1 Glucose-methanol-choline oxidoreductase [Cordyceps fumosorosea ARSEF 2679]